MEAAMTNAADAGQPTAGGAGLPPVAGRVAFQAELDKPRLAAGRSDDLGSN